ncbi:MAG: HNH endonuclease [Clostridia bacterium]|nr:HNH endonuclease [Clostridia bacterium]
MMVLNNEQLLSLTPEQYNLYTDSLNSMSPEDRENFDSSFVQAEKDNYWKHVNNGDYERNSSIERDLDDIADGKYQGDDNIEGNVIRYTSMAGTWTLETAAHVDNNIKSDMVNQVGDFAEAYGPQIMNDMAQTAYVQYGVHTPTPIVHVDEYGNKTYDYGNESTAEFNDIGKLKTEYADDLMNRSEYPQTIDQNKIYNDWNKIPADQNEIMRENFGKSKNKLISQWENENNISWPTYKENVYSSNGKLLRRAGDKYDGHHIQPLTFGGENTSTNLTPLHVLEHYDKQGIHATDSAFGKIENYYKEK